MRHPTPGARPPDPTHEELGRLARILALEERGGYRDRAAIGGISAYVRLMVSRLTEAETPVAILAQATRLRDLLVPYSDSPPAERAQLATTARGLLCENGVPGPATPAAPPNSARVAPGSNLGPAASMARHVRPDGSLAPARPPDVGGERNGAGSPTQAALPDSPTQEKRQAPRRKPDPAFPAPDRPLLDVPGVGAGRMRLLARLGLTTVENLLRHFPLRHVDYPPPARASDLFFQQRASFVGVVRRVDVHRTARGLQRTTAVLGDATGEVEAVWFRAGYGLRLAPGQRIAVSGDLVLNGRRPGFENPEWEPADQGPLHTRCLVPIYPTTKGVAQSWLRELIARAVDRWADDVSDPLPDALRGGENLLPRAAALRAMHYPTDAEEADAARRRFAFDELFLLQVAVLQRRRAAEAVRGRPLPAPEPLLRDFAAALPFALTAAQERVIGEICGDLARPSPMTRLLQGEVGSGKTVVAAVAMLVALAAGGQAALMAPTEILAEQHYRTLGALYERAGDALTATLGRTPTVGLLTGRLPARERRAMRERIAAGEVDVVIGTQAVIQDSVEFRALLLAVADEQHRFGVRQRLALRDKGLTTSSEGNTPDGGARWIASAASVAEDDTAEPALPVVPHLLVMTATPIPRTLALTLYGDLDLSRLDGLPPGRKPIRTVLLKPAERRHAYERMRREVTEGRQGYVICPLVEDSPHLEARAATEEYARLQQHELAGLRLGLVHGRLRADEKEAVMGRFRDGAIDVLVATAVVEVGVDVPNATLMLIEGAERFGLAQLHQFRGRIGRGEHPATCVLVTEASSPEVQERLQVVANSTDGLALAEADLKLRGPGDYYGLRQSGLPDLQVASLSDVALIERARTAAQRLLGSDPDLTRPEHAALAAAVRAQAQRVGDPS